MTGTRAPGLVLRAGWHFGTRLGRHFGPVAGLVVEKRGYAVHASPTSPTMTAAFGVREGHFTVAARTDGVPGASTNVPVATFGLDTDAREAKSVGAAILSTLFE